MAVVSRAALSPVQRALLSATKRSFAGRRRRANRLAAPPQTIAEFLPRAAFHPAARALAQESDGLPRRDPCLVQWRAPNESVLGRTLCAADKRSPAAPQSARKKVLLQWLWRGG